MKLDKALTKLLRERRVAKQTLSCLNTIRSSTLHSNNVGWHAQIDPVLANLRKQTQKYYTFNTDIVAETLGDDELGAGKRL